MHDIKVIAIHLPQFHPICENDEWWGKGFTEWINVAKAKPLFKNHYQPHLPSNLGFYDLRLEESRIAQATLAKEYGISGFCYYHYWFNGRRLIERPFEEILASGRPDFPFCLFWANETWSRRWLGEEKEILLKQTYSTEDDLRHAAYLAKVFEDQRYMKVDGKPLFLIYRPNDLPDISKTISIIKETTYQRYKVEPYIVASNAHSPLNQNLIDYGFDAILNFRPQLSALNEAFNDQISIRKFLKNISSLKVLSAKLKIYSYSEGLRAMEMIEPGNFENVIPTVFVGWDNTARRGDKGIIMTDNTPQLFGDELRRVCKKLSLAKSSPKLLFINAWNEWAEGNHLEPDHRFGLQYLEMVKKVFYNDTH